MVAAGITEINQGILEKVVHEIFVGEKIYSNVRKGADIRNQLSGNFLELDVWIPSLSICFEFQDPYHYTSVWDSQQPVARVHQKDNLKHALLRERSETLVVIPCWWDGSEKSLGGTVLFYRTDLLPMIEQADSLGDPIPINPPSNFFFGGLPGVGLLMLASFPASVEFKVSISASKTWWMGEKYDGARVCWNSEVNQLYSRAGGEMELPSEFEAGLKQITSFMDAELWFGRGCFSYAQRVLVGSPEDAEYPDMRLVTFDEPSCKQQEEEFETRYALLVKHIQSSHPFVHLAPRLLCSTKRQVKAFVQVILDDGGEGIVMRRPRSKYEHGRSPALVKLKAARGDKEGLVLEVIGTKAARIKLPDRATFIVPFEKWSNLKPAVGDIVTFSYEAYSVNSIPTKPTIIKIRSDLSWENIVQEHRESSRQTQFLNTDSKHVFEALPKPFDYWTSHEGQNMRLAFEQFAKSQKFDPLEASNWYSTSTEDLKQFKGTRALLRSVKGNYSTALVSLFPEVTFNLAKFDNVRTYQYKNMSNRRLFFERFAKKQGFDPLVASNWYKIKVESMLEKEKDVKKVIQYHRSSHISALLDLFPDIGLDKYMFSHLPDKYWHDITNQRKFAVRVARECGFDPLVATNWYSIRKQNFLDYKGGSSFMQTFAGNKVTALMSIFPDIGLDPKKFAKTKNFSNNIKQRRQFFEDYARRKMFDPLSPTAWYQISLANIVLTQVGRSVLRPYQGSLTAALQHLFPDVHLDVEKFVHLQSRDKWATAHSRRDFFINFATAYQFNPLLPQSWYSNPISYWLRKTDNAMTVCSYYSGDYVKALLHLFPEIGLRQIEFHKVRQLRQQRLYLNSNNKTL